MSNNGPVFSRRGFLTRAGGTVLMGALGATALAACATGEATPAKSASSDKPVPLVPFTFLSFLPVSSFTVSPEMMGVAGGYFAKNGLDATLQAVKGSAQATQLLVANKGQVARNGAIDAMTAGFTQNLPVKIVGVNTYGSAIRILTTKDTPNPSDWVGKTIGVPSVNGTSDKTLSAVLHDANIDPTSVKRQLVGLTPGTFELVRNGSLAGYMVSLDTALIVLKQNPDAVSFAPTNVTKVGDNIYMTSQDQIDQHGDEIKKYFLSIKQATSDMIADEAKGFDKTIKTLRSAYDFASLADEDIAKGALKAYSHLWPDAKGNLLTIDMDRLEESYRQMVDLKVVPAGKDIESIVDTSLLPK
jgi:NitT/TauT family transport system substrate-binding protein